MVSIIVIHAVDGNNVKLLGQLNPPCAAWCQRSFRWMQVNFLPNKWKCGNYECNG